jgi:hypothetical protein
MIRGGNLQSRLSEEQQRRELGLIQGGIGEAGTTEAVGAANRIRQAMSDLQQGRVSGGTWGGAENFLQDTNQIKTFVNSIAAMAQTDPNGARQLAASVLNALPPVGADGYSSGPVGGNLFITGLAGLFPVNQRNREQVANNLNEIYQTLSRLAQQ